jgi:hypothetical protein
MIGGDWFISTALKLILPNLLSLNRACFEYDFIKPAIEFINILMLLPFHIDFFMSKKVYRRTLIASTKCTLISGGIFYTHQIVNND